MSKKPSRAMLRVMEKLVKGWELGRSGGFGAGAFMQEGRIGYGGKGETVHHSTFFALYHRGWLKKVTGGGYKLNDEGLTALRTSLRGGGADPKEESDGKVS